MREREYSRSPHPPYCTCVRCTERRTRRLDQERAPIIGPLRKIWWRIREVLAAGRRSGPG